MLAAFLRQNEANAEKCACFELRSTTKPTLMKNEKYPPGSVLIRTIAASICGSDFSGQGPMNDADSSCNCEKFCWRRPLDFLKELSDNQVCGGTGHELLGQIVQVVEPCSLQVGQRVLAFSPSYFKRVMKEEIQQKFNAKDLTIFNDQGGFAQYFLSHEAVCLPVPTEDRFDAFDPLWFVIAQPLGTILHACNHLENIMGKSVAVVGQGQNGLIMTQLLAGYKPRKLIVLDLLRERLEAAKRYQVTHTIQVQRNCNMIDETKKEVSKITNGEMCDVVVDMVGHQGTSVDLCAQLTKSYGTVLLFGIPPAKDEGTFSIQTHDFYRNIQYVTSHSPKLESFKFAIELLEQKRFDPTGIFTHRFPFESFTEAYDMAQNYQNGVIKILLTFENTPNECTSTEG